ncbi:hypothetical protein G159_13805 [Planococcus glaciei CHR43]|nr:hypothetical protein G159_13805 [Planococcus glaciei CHR43]
MGKAEMFRFSPGTGNKEHVCRKTELKEGAFYS